MRQCIAAPPCIAQHKGAAEESGELDGILVMGVELKNDEVVGEANVGKVESAASLVHQIRGRIPFVLLWDAIAVRICPRVDLLAQAIWIDLLCKLSPKGLRLNWPGSTGGYTSFSVRKAT